MTIEELIRSFEYAFAAGNALQYLSGEHLECIKAEHARRVAAEKALNAMYENCDTPTMYWMEAFSEFIEWQSIVKSMEAGK